jgi:F-type H+-transporting ATPase subunit alpha
MSVEKQVMILYAAINGFLDDVPVEQLGRFEEEFHRFMESSHPEAGEAIARERDISEQTEEVLKAAIGEFKQSVSLA